MGDDAATESFGAVPKAANPNGPLFHARTVRCPGTDRKSFQFSLGRLGLDARSEMGFQAVDFRINFIDSLPMVGASLASKA